mmetsp:Transcript_45846/g.58869  ORF Transcript_45846/g.58869 Transcript_45846/m.58869 type:complete len:141 (+) Transcript_45846:428-850(+)
MLPLRPLLTQLIQEVDRVQGKQTNTSFLMDFIDSGYYWANSASEVQQGALVTDSSDERPVVDESKPKTTVMVRLTNGKRLKAVLNLTHTVQHLQSLIRAEGAGDEPYVLMAGFPPAQLTDSSVTIEAAGLAGSQVTQKKA